MKKFFSDNYFSTKYILSICIIFSILLFIYSQVVGAQPVSSDAIAIRVIPNPSHLATLDWFQAQNFSGSPQTLIIDGYEAIRDGRTVYVNAANIIGNTLYTNIYIISYNQDSEQATIDIFGRIIKRWKFNTNVTTTGHCRGDMSKICLVDSECAEEDFCDSKKSRVVRDVRRLSDLSIAKKMLEAYKNENGYYPKLSQGTYLPQKSISTWPSWQNEFSSELNAIIPIDPVNKMGNCSDARFTEISCWDELKKQFDDQDTATPELDLPNNSLVYTYHGTPNGSYYNFCGVMESGYILPTGDCSASGICLSGGDNSVNVQRLMMNNPPAFTGYNFPIIYSGEEYKGYIEASDPDGDALTWTIIPSAWIGWPISPVLLPTSTSKQRMIYSPVSGSPGIHNFTLRIDDNRGEANSIVEKDFYLILAAIKPVISPFSCTLVIREGANYPACTITATHPHNNVTAFYANGLPGGISINQTSTGLISVAEITGIPETGSAGVYLVAIKAVEATGAESDIVEYSLTVNNYCGDSITQIPNTEGIGGQFDDGNEECDLTDNIAINTTDSSVNKEYACDPNCEYTGGYCGDLSTQTAYEECDDGINGNDYDTCYDNCTNTFCGDNIIQSPNGNSQNEQCDEAKLNGETCQSHGFADGDLACQAVNCQFDESGCCNLTDGYWSGWVDGACIPTSGAYGSGTMTQTKTCTPPVCGGADCAGSNSQSVSCCLPRTTCDGNCGSLSSGCTGVPDLDCGSCCTPDAWSPLTDSRCVGEEVIQSDGCSNQTVSGTKTCPSGQPCLNGVCGVCDECTEGAKQCSGYAVQACSDYDGDGCTEWQNEPNCTYGCALFNGTSECIETHEISRCVTGSDHLVVIGSASECTTYGYTWESSYRICSKAYSGTSDLKRCFNDTSPFYDHMVSFGCASEVVPGYNEQISLGYIPSSDLGFNMRPLYRCYQSLGSSLDHFISPQSACEGQTLDGGIGYYFQ